MSKRVRTLIVVASLLMGAGCMTAPFQPPQGLYTSINAPLGVNYAKTPVGGKSGSASAYNILGLVAFGDVGVQAAALNGGLSFIDHADYSYLNVFYLYQRTTVTVYGE